MIRTNTDRVMLLRAYEQTYDDLKVVSFLIYVDNMYLYGINEYTRIRVIDDRFDIELSGWKLQTDNPENVFDELSKRGSGHTLMEVKDAEHKWCKTLKFITEYFQDIEYGDGWFNICPIDEKDGIGINDFKIFIEVDCNYQAAP